MHSKGRPMTSRVVFLLLIMACSLASVANSQATNPPGRPCERSSSIAQPFCQCKIGTKLYDFSSLELPPKAERTYFVNINTGNDTESYIYYNPCVSVPLKQAGKQSHCVAKQKGNQAALCLWNTSSPVYMSLGKLGSGRSFLREDGILFSFDDGTDGLQSSILFKCDKTVAPHKEKIEFVQNSPASNFSLLMKTALACEPRTLRIHTLSLGSMFLILFFVTGSGYLLAGTVYNINVKQRPRAEAIPHYVFWTELPSLVMDGVQLLCPGCRATTSASNYRSL